MLVCKSHFHIRSRGLVPGSQSTTIVTEVGTFQRFRRATELMGYSGLVPSEYSSGGKESKGRITRTGNAHLRHVLGETACHCRHKPWLSNRLKQVLPNLTPGVSEIAWKAQERLHRKFAKMTYKSKQPGKVLTEISPGKRQDLHCTTAGYTPHPFGCRGFAVVRPLAPGCTASNPISVRQPAVYAHHFLQPRSHDLRLVVCSSFLQPGFSKDFHLLVFLMLDTRTKVCFRQTCVNPIFSPARNPRHRRYRAHGHRPVNLVV